MYNINFILLTIWNVQYSGINCIHCALQPSPYPFLKLLHHPRLKLCTLEYSLNECFGRSSYSCIFPSSHPFNFFLTDPKCLWFVPTCLRPSMGQKKPSQKRECSWGSSVGKEASRGNRGVLTDPLFPGTSDTALQMMAQTTLLFLVTGEDPEEAQPGLCMTTPGLRELRWEGPSHSLTRPEGSWSEPLFCSSFSLLRFSTELLNQETFNHC